MLVRLAFRLRIGPSVYAGRHASIRADDSGLCCCDPFQMDRYINVIAMPGPAGDVASTDFVSDHDAWERFLVRIHVLVR